MVVIFLSNESLSSFALPYLTKLLVYKDHFLCVV